jgi:L-alanine-DL-glutamate epimerase-like enolase superfamily enzyme
VRAEVEPFTLRLREPLVTSGATVSERTLLILRVEDAEGRVGWGEAAPLEHYDGVPAERCRTALDAHVAVLRAGAAHAQGGAALLDACRDADPLPQALAAVDLALWSLAGARESRSVAEMLTDEPLASVPVNATIGAVDRASAAGLAADAVAAGFPCVKLKVGAGDDAGRVAAVRAAAGPRPALRLDANGAWDVETAARTIEALGPAGLELVEEPVHGVAALRELRERVAVRIAMDETCAEPGALASGAADAVCLKISRAGGISALLAQAALVRTTGAEVYIASTLDGPLGIAAAVHCAAALRVELPCGLATLDMFEDLDPGPLVPVAGRIAVPREPGLGVKPAE